MRERLVIGLWMAGLAVGVYWYLALMSGLPGGIWNRGRSAGPSRLAPLAFGFACGVAALRTTGKWRAALAVFVMVVWGIDLGVWWTRG